MYFLAFLDPLGVPAHKKTPTSERWRPRAQSGMDALDQRDLTAPCPVVQDIFLFRSSVAPSLEIPEIALLEKFDILQNYRLCFVKLVVFVLSQLGMRRLMLHL